MPSLHINNQPLPAPSQKRAAETEALRTPEPSQSLQNMLIWPKNEPLQSVRWIEELK